MVRGLHPWPHARTILDGARAIILRTRLGDPCEAAPGAVVSSRPDGIEVAAGDRRSIVIEELQIEGRRPMTARDFLAGRPVQAGLRLGEQ